MSKIWLSLPHMGGSEERYVAEAFSSGWLSTIGPNLDAFEQGLSERVGWPSVALASGTAAIHLGLRLLGVGPGDVVFTQDLTFAASVNPIVYCGATPVFIDSERSSWNMDPNVLEEALADADSRGELPKVVLFVDLFGQCADADAITEVCRRYGVATLEDAAEAVGATYKGRAAGQLGDVGVYSFNGNKLITTTGGGALFAERKEDVDKVRFWSTQSKEPGISYTHKELGFNYRMSNVLAGIGRGQLEVVDDWVAKRRAHFEAYCEELGDVPGWTPAPDAGYGLHTRWLSCFLVELGDFGMERDSLVNALNAADIDCRPVWKCMTQQPYYSKFRRYGGEVAAELSGTGICLPSSSSMTTLERGRVVSEIKKVVRV